MGHVPGLKPSTKTISLRLPEWMLEQLRRLANKTDVPYQSVARVFLSERIEWELQKHDPPGEHHGHDSDAGVQDEHPQG